MPYGRAAQLPGRRSARKRFGPVGYAITHGVLDAVWAGVFPKQKADDLGIIVSVWLDPSITEVAYDPEVLFRTNREAIDKAMRIRITPLFISRLPAAGARGGMAQTWLEFPLARSLAISPARPGRACRGRR